MAGPPLEAGAVQAAVIVVALAPMPGVSVRLVGAPGAETAVADAEADAEPVPMPFVAVTVNVYVVPAVRPVTVQLVAGATAVQDPDGLTLTVYPVTAEPPSDAGADHDAVIWALPSVRERPTGREGMVT